MRFWASARARASAQAVMRRPRSGLDLHRRIHHHRW
jgi:hypothetical protein